jgi:tetratricopeptide (TPR) repeat protein
MIKKVVLSAVLFGAVLCLTAGECFADAASMLDQAEQYEDDGNYSQAETIYKTISADYPGSDDALTAEERLTALYVVWGKQPEADAAYQQLLSDFSSHVDIAKAVDHVADAYRNIENYTKCVELYQHIVTTWPNAQHAMWSQAGLAKSNILLEDYGAAEAAVDKLITDFADDHDLAKALVEIAAVYRQGQEFTRAEELYKRVLDIASDAEQRMYAQAGLAKTHILFRDYPGARSATETLIADFSASPGLPEQLFEIAKECQVEREFQEAKSLYERVVQHDSDGEYAQRARLYASKLNVFLLIHSGDSTAAATAVDNFIAEFGSQDFKDDDEFPESLYDLAKEYEEAGVYANALSLYQQVIQQYPETDHAGKARLDIPKADIFSLIDSGNEAQAWTAFETLIADFSDHPKLDRATYKVAERYYRKASKMEDQGQAEQARPYIQRAMNAWEMAIDRFPGTPSAVKGCLWMGYCCQKLAEYGRSIVFYQKVVDDYPGYRLAYYALLMVGRNYESLKRSGLMGASEADAKAKAAYEQLLQQYPDCSSVDYAQSWLDLYHSKHGDK